MSLSIHDLRAALPRSSPALICKDSHSFWTWHLMAISLGVMVCGCNWRSQEPCCPLYLCQEGCISGFQTLHASLVRLTVWGLKQVALKCWLLLLTVWLDAKPVRNWGVELVLFPTCLNLVLFPTCLDLGASVPAHSFARQRILSPPEGAILPKTVQLWCFKILNSPSINPFTCLLIIVRRKRNKFKWP